MKNLKIYLTAFIAIVFCINATAQSVDEIIDKHIEAIGGNVNIQAVKTMKIIGSAKVMGMEFPFITYNENPDKFYFELSIRGTFIKQAYDGTKAWAVNPMGGSDKPEYVEGDEANSIKERARIFNKLISYKDDGASVELIGKEQSNNLEVYKIQYTGLDGKNILYYLDSENLMVVKTQYKLKIQGSEMDSETIYSNYKKVGDIMMSYSFDVKTKNSQMGTQEIFIDKIEINPTIDGNIFNIPSK